MSSSPLIIAALVATTAASYIAGDAPAGVEQTTTQPVFSVRSDLVVLHVMVKDRNGYVTDLPPDAFQVFDEGIPQPIQLFVTQDAPVTVGLLVDSSGSMGNSRDGVIAAAGAFADASNPSDEIFALAFNERVRPALPPDYPFTGDSGTLRAALATAIAARGKTALHDAITAGLDHLTKGSHLTRALVIVADGGDNASATTFEQALRKTQASNAVIYTIALVDPVDRTASPGRLRQLADASGGQAFSPHDLAGIEQALRRVAEDLRHTYTIGYTPTNVAYDGRLRRVRVGVGAPGRPGLHARTRQRYVLEER